MDNYCRSSLLHIISLLLLGWPEWWWIAAAVTDEVEEVRMVMWNFKAEMAAESRR